MDWTEHYDDGVWCCASLGSWYQDEETYRMMRRPPGPCDCYVGVIEALTADRDMWKGRHSCDLPDDHEGPCWHESGTEDD